MPLYLAVGHRFEILRREEHRRAVLGDSLDGLPQLDAPGAKTARRQRYLLTAASARSRTIRPGPTHRSQCDRSREAVSCAPCAASSSASFARATPCDLLGGWRHTGVIGPTAHKASRIHSGTQI